MNLSATSAPCYKRRRIGTLFALSKALGIPCCELLSIAENANNLYRVAKSITKPDGSIRITYDAKEPLKTVHRKIKHHILDYVEYPHYLTGCIKGRDCKINAALHASAKIVITEDIRTFFPSTSRRHIFEIWRYFFGFSDEVAQCLMKLTALIDELPQGAITSSFIANLVFWQDESMLHDYLADQGLIYSRYVDDIAVSSRKNLTSDEKSDVIRRIYGLLSKHGYSPNRKKQEIHTSRRRMAVTKLSINGNNPGMEKSARGEIRAIVHDIEKRFENKEKLSPERGLYVQAMGKVLYMERFHPGEAKLLKERLLDLKEKIAADYHFSCAAEN